jgi:UDP-N-acetylglucosamine 2-epimerase
MFADKIAAIDQYSRQIYLKRGKVESQRIAVTGLPRWDSMIEALREWRFRSLEDKERTRTNLLAQLHLDVEEDVQLVLFAAQNLPFSHTWEMLEPLLKSLAAFQNTLLVVKLHPADSLSVAEYEQQFASLNLHGCRVVVVNEIRLPTLLAHSEVVVTGFSNVALEAALLDKPVLIVNLTGRPDPLPFVSNGIALGAYTESEAREKLTGLLTNSQVTEALRIRREEYFRQNPQLMDGRATERVVNLLHEIAAPPRQGVK